MSTQPCSNVRIWERCRCPLNWTRSCTRTLKWVPVPASVDCVHTFPFNSEVIHCYHLSTLVSARERYPGLVVRRQGKRESGASVLKWMFMIEITPGLTESKYYIVLIVKPYWPALITGARLALRAKCRFFPRLAHEGSGATNENIVQNHLNITLLIKTHFSI